MPLPEDIQANLLRRLVEEAELSEEACKNIITSLNSDKAINWNLLLNSELKQPIQITS